jgi:glycosyltransferase involved in cell wall biosynthesis
MHGKGITKGLVHKKKCFIMKVLLVPSSDYIGHPFPQRHNQIFERLHDGKNFEVHVVRFRLFDKPKLKTKLVIHELDGKKIRNVALYYLTNAINHTSQIRRIIREEGIDVVVLSNLAQPFAYTLMNEISSFHIPIIFDLPDYYPTSAAGYMFDVRSLAGELFAGMFDFILCYMIKRATVVTVASHALEEYAKRAGAQKVVYVPNGIGECFLKLHDGNTLREKFGYSENDLVAGYIGSLEFWLDMKSFITGVSSARKMGLPVNLLLVGSKLHTNFSDKVIQWIKRKNIEKHTEFIGFVPYEDVPKYVASFNVGIIPFDVSNPTAFYAAPNKMWEYLSQRKPVISTPIPEAVNNSDCVFTALTPEDYAHKLSIVAERKTEVYQKTEIGYRKALDRTWKNSADLFGSTIYSLFSQK